MHAESGNLAVGVMNDHLVETLPGWITLPCLQHDPEPQRDSADGRLILPLSNNCQKPVVSDGAVWRCLSFVRMRPLPNGLATHTVLSTGEP